MAIRSNALSQLSRYATPAARGTLFLMGVDAVTNLMDYGFHAYLGRALVPAEFAIVQTLNSLILILMTTFGVLQPVVARFVAESEAGGEQEAVIPGRVIFQHYFRSAAVIGFVLLALALLIRQPLASWLNVPTVALSLALFILPLALLRPVVAGLLQGQERMVAFGLTRTFHALGRFVSAIILVALLGMLGAVASFSIGAACALAAGLVFAGRKVWRPGPPMPSRYLSLGVRLAAAALFAYAAYMSLLNIDLIAVNRSFEPEVAGSYATAVLLRRVLTLVPGAIIVVMYPTRRGPHRPGPATRQPLAENRHGHRHTDPHSDSALFRFRLRHRATGIWQQLHAPELAAGLGGRGHVGLQLRRDLDEPLPRHAPIAFCAADRGSRCRPDIAVHAIQHEPATDRRCLHARRLDLGPERIVDLSLLPAPVARSHLREVLSSMPCVRGSHQDLPEVEISLP